MSTFREAVEQLDEWERREEVRRKREEKELLVLIQSQRSLGARRLLRPVPRGVEAVPQEIT